MALGSVLLNFRIWGFTAAGLQQPGPPQFPALARYSIEPTKPISTKRGTIIIVIITMTYITTIIYMIAIITIFNIQNEGSRQGAFRLKPKAPGEVGDELLRQVTELVSFLRLLLTSPRSEH